MTQSKIWNIVTSQYGVDLRSELDMSLGVSEIIDKLRQSVPGINTGNSLDFNFYEPPLSYIFVNNKTIGTAGQQSALTECELTIYQNADNTLRFRYFIQVTHGSLIHGLSWVKANTDIQHKEQDFASLLKYVKTNFINSESGVDSPTVPDKYAVMDGHRNRLGTMYNFTVRGFAESTVMNDKTIGKIVSLMHNAVTFFRNNQQAINNIITKQNQE